MGGYPVWQVTNYLFRSEEELKCDKYISERWIFMDRVSVVAEWANSGATGVRAPEIASDSKLGCLREGGRMQEREAWCSAARIDRLPSPQMAGHIGKG